MKDTSKLGEYFGAMKKAIEIPLTIKIRIGWDDDSINADEVIRIAWNEGVEFVAIHGRTRAQQYKGQARWDYLEGLNANSPLPLIGNGDLHTSYLVKKRLEKTTCDALMLGRGALRNPFLFLESYVEDHDHIDFTPLDYLEVIQRLFEYTEAYTDNRRVVAVQMRKHIVWFAAGFPGAAAFRNAIFQTQDLEETLKLTEEYFMTNAQSYKQIDYAAPFMTSGHG
jgi:tRNA-dihydrouridine synthase B